MVVIQQGPLECSAQIRIPVQCHHVGKIVSADVDAPGIPIKDSNIIAGASLWQEYVPDVGVAVEDRHIAMGMIALVQTRAGVDQPLEQLAPLGRQAVTDTIDKAGEFRRELLEMT